MKMVLAAAILAVLAFGEVQGVRNVCEGKNGKKLVTFSDTMEQIKFPCKYNAVRDTVCGSYRVTVSPGNMLENDRNKLYV
ncbi:uncharacterized protein LOC143298270, partial [Babylonia areolata]